MLKYFTEFFSSVTMDMGDRQWLACQASVSNKVVSEMALTWKSQLQEVVIPSSVRIGFYSVSELISCLKIIFPGCKWWSFKNSSTKSVFWCNLCFLEPNVENVHLGLLCRGVVTSFVDQLLGMFPLTAFWWSDSRSCASCFQFSIINDLH